MPSPKTHPLAVVGPGLDCHPLRYSRRFLHALSCRHLWLNNRSSLIGRLRNSWVENLGLTLSLLLFSVLAILEVLKRFLPDG